MISNQEKERGITLIALIITIIILVILATITIKNLTESGMIDVATKEVRKLYK